MKTTTASKRKKRIWRIILILLTALGFSYLYTRGVSPVWAAVAIVFCRGFFRFLYAIACLRNVCKSFNFCTTHLSAKRMAAANSDPPFVKVTIIAHRNKSGLDMLAGFFGQFLIFPCHSAALGRTVPGTLRQTHGKPLSREMEIL